MTLSEIQYLQGLKESAGDIILMVNKESDTRPQYRLYVILKNDLFAAEPEIGESANFRISFSLSILLATELSDRTVDETNTRLRSRI
jgi:hypothetical protein